MATTTIGLFDDNAQAQEAIEHLVSSGFDRSSIHIINNADDLSMVRGVPSGDAEFYRDYLGQNGLLVAVTTEQGRASEAAQILASGNVVDADARSMEYRQKGVSNAQLRDYDDHDVVLPVIEENIQVGKRQVESGRMRIYTEVTETPVEEQVTLREERVNVERRPVDRAISSADMTNFKEGEMEIRTMSEEAVVSKEARVVEEVVVGKEMTERTETIRDSVRRTDVQVDENVSDRTVTGTNVSSTSGNDYDTYSTGFRSYYDSNMSSSGSTYEQHDPAFRYGYTLANDDNLRGKDWESFESSAHSRWEERNPGTWEQFKDSIRYAWDNVRGKR